MECQEAARGGDAERRRAAREEMDAACEEMACVGGLLLVMALDHGGLVIQRRLEQVFGGFTRDAWERARQAQARADRALEDIDALTQRIRELEKRLETRADLRLVR